MRKLTILVASALLLFCGLIGFGLYLDNLTLLAWGVLLPLPLMVVGGFLEKRLDSEDARKTSYARMWKIAQRLDAQVNKVLLPHAVIGVFVFALGVFNFLRDRLQHVSDLMAGIYTAGILLLILCAFLYMFSSRERMERYFGKAMITILVLSTLLLVYDWVVGEPIPYSRIVLPALIAELYRRWRKLDPETREKGRKAFLPVLFVLFLLADILLLSVLITAL